jgi:5-methylcytosine-specific restriction endonuclease McrA
MKRGRRVNPRSQKRIDEQMERAEVRERALRKAGFRCCAPGVAGISCGGPLDVDEIIPRGVRPGGHLEDDNVQVLCRRHHDWKTQNPAAAHAAGLRRWSWENNSAD